MRPLFSLAIGSVALALAACSPASETSPPQQPAAEAPAETPVAEAPAANPIELAIVDASGVQLSGDPERGRRIFSQCATCHSIDVGVNRVGPSLHGVIGRMAGTVDQFRYSDANRNSAITWTEQALFDYLENPRQTIPGTIMAFAGIRNPQQRADVIAYIKTASEAE